MSLPLGTQQKNELFETWINFISNLAQWKNFVTLTYADECPYPDKAWMNYYSLIRVLNKKAFGKSYTRKVGHCYFSYAVAMEYQKRDVPHFHFLADQFLDYSLIHDYWGSSHGFAYIEQIKNIRGVSYYMGKYLLKGGEVTLYKAGLNKEQSDELTKFAYKKLAEINERKNQNET